MLGPLSLLTSQDSVKQEITDKVEREQRQFYWAADESCNLGAQSYGDQTSIHLEIGDMGFIRSAGGPGCWSDGCTFCGSMRAQHPGWTELSSCSPILHWVVRLWKVAPCDVNSISDMSDGSLSHASNFPWSNNGLLWVFTPSQFWRHLDFIFLNSYFYFLTQRLVLFA